ncbi:hypothetical protein I4I73_16100 [Pseudonocardia sp. KRD-184]|uniref:Uncharacterized protein n=1 Tax=Pseudonocardia oceani TaxID=2792013 RepID=A0ABS6UGD3_9PSEU|nr:hypothetical protein [Pseudonocardia oceani]MBW0090309.1 hypothetical protein [Pseudonocardia oceani]MBW0097505.1 hypothetical protein [Pseudonocardia oceani]MBW0111809.1 hypothetical protein [Pseudonocardia oceani]MBW0123508.1 hypothetical protein [Pseudonocardia oceani]MBW0131288.1 hypothetical protein [Pseudonocardia oceani]
MDEHDGPARGGRSRPGAGSTRGDPRRRAVARPETMEPVPLWVLPTIVLALAALSGSIAVFGLAVLAVVITVLVAQEVANPSGHTGRGGPAPWRWH